MKTLKVASFFVISLFFTPIARPTDATLLGWNNLGMHCMDSDYSVFSILPPYNTIHAQLIIDGKLMTNGGEYTVTYQAIADPAGSINSTAIGKGNFYIYAKALYGAELGAEQGLAGWSMPGLTNVPQSMLFEQTNQPAKGVSTLVNWFRAEGIPISPYDDAGKKNPYPMLRLIAWNSANQPIATNDIVLPVSDEMDCRACHASGAMATTMPKDGWAWDGFPERDFRLNILRLHDQKQFTSNAVLYQAALAARGFNSQGLYRGVVADKKPVLCAVCHASEALGTTSYSVIPPLTSSMHAYHAHVEDPDSGVTLDSSDNRAACYRCHPGSTTRCLRGAMGRAISSNGSLQMQCQSCHGSMSAVGSTSRVGWFMEPNCQNCHTGTATQNKGSIRFTSAFDTNGLPRVPANTNFATTPKTPTLGLSLYRFSIGHGGIQCSACHGSTHAEFPSLHANDNVRNITLQGHEGVTIECNSCHSSMPINSSTAFGGPHGMHPVGQDWVSGHGDIAESNLSKCASCHGADYRGTELSRAQGNRTLQADLEGGSVTLSLVRGANIGCYNCHNGPGENFNDSPIPTASLVSGDTLNSAPLMLPVTVTPTTAVLRVISQPDNGSVGVSNHVLIYFPREGFVGEDTFTYSAWNGQKNSALATGTVTVGPGPFSVGANAHAPQGYPAGWPVPFRVDTHATNTEALITCVWNFGDGSAECTDRFPTHAYANAGIYQWSVSAGVPYASANATGFIEIGDPISLSIQHSRDSVTLSWPATLADTLLEATTALSESSGWLNLTNQPVSNGGNLEVTFPHSSAQFFRIRRTW